MFSPILWNSLIHFCVEEEIVVQFFKKSYLSRFRFLAFRKQAYETSRISPAVARDGVEFDIENI